MAKRDEYTELLKKLDLDPAKRSLSAAEQKTEKELLDGIAKADAAVKRHLEAAAAEENAVRLPKVMRKFLPPHDGE
jgi:hypothetical protein